MLPTLVLCLTIVQPGVLKCHADSHGRLIVSKKQWKYIHRELATLQPGHVLPLIHPRLGLTYRVVNTSFPTPSGEIKVDSTRKSRADIAEALKGAKTEYNAYHPGYTFLAASSLTPGKVLHYSGIGTDRVRMKGMMLYLDEAPGKGAGVLPRLDNTKDAALRYRQNLKRFSPTTYIAMFCDEGRLWIKEISSDWPAE